MNIAVIGSKGQLGTHLLQSFETKASHKVFALDLPEFDILESSDEMIKKLSEVAPKIIINCAAYTQVDKAESESELAFQINGKALIGLSTAANHFGATLIHISTDFVFDGSQNTPYNESDICKPLGAYGASKRQGEEAIIENCQNYLIIRTAWLYSSTHPSFLTTMLRLANEKDSLGVVADQVGSPTSARSLAEAITNICDRNLSQEKEIYHYSNLGTACWYDFAHSIFDLWNKKLELKAINTSDYPTPAERPHYSVLDKKKFMQRFSQSIPHWRDELKAIYQALS